jgi:hypothetical protein
MNLKELSQALKELAAYIEWERESIEDFHRYGYMFDATPGSNVFTFVLEDALRHRGITLEQFRAMK